MTRSATKVLAGLLLCALTGFREVRAATPSELTVRLELATDQYIVGERIRAVVDVANASGDVIDCRGEKSKDVLTIELFRASDKYQFEKASDTPFTAGFALLSGEGQRLETFIADHFPFRKATAYQARAVLVHDGMRFESPLRNFSLVPGMKCGGAVQLFESRDGMKRELELVHWNRDRVEHLFLKARDEGGSLPRRWTTTDLGPVLRVTPPKLSVLPSGEVIVLHRVSQDAFVRSEFWSIPGAFEFNLHEVMMDPEVAGAKRVREVYKESGGVEPVKKAWWKFW